MKDLRNFTRLIVISIRQFILSKLYKMNIDTSARISYGAKLDKTNPKGVFIGEESYVASGAIIFTHDFSRGLKMNTFIGKRCFIGANSIILPGVKIGNEVIVGSGSIVTKNIPSNCVVAGNPAKILKRNINTSKFGQLKK